MINPDDARQSVFGQSVDEFLDDLSRQPRPVDLRSIPRDQWKAHVGSEITLPPEIERYLDGQAKLSESEVQNIELALETYHGITDPFAAYLFVPATGRPTAQLILAEDGK